MFIFVALIAILLLVSIYLFFRAENLEKQLTLFKREAKQIKKDNAVIIDTMIMAASKNEEFAKFRLQQLKKDLSDEKAETFKDELTLLTILTANYSAIYKECVKGNIPFKSITKTCFDSFSPEAFQNFNQYIADQDPAIKKMWASNNLQGFISLVEALILQMSKKIQA